ncbi:hypothetical protein H6P81_018242 [Aristolochia fimbriata]|uniref:RNA-directed DNA polymerase n=1 Tax=Aristolochia fimbriata TaxID=158543 RepID=A0AAV7E0V5_ARIFI|nr:hypothetical protein H6P81_018242 [Aristolochia fimbriata]
MASNANNGTNNNNVNNRGKQTASSSSAQPRSAATAGSTTGALAPTPPPPVTRPMTRALARNLSIGQTPFIHDARRPTAVFVPQAIAASVKQSAATAKLMPTIAKPTYLAVATSPPPCRLTVSPTQSPPSRRTSIVPALVQQYEQSGGISSSSAPRTHSVSTSFVQRTSATDNSPVVLVSHDLLAALNAAAGPPPIRSPRRQTSAISPAAISFVPPCRISPTAATTSRSPLTATPQSRTPTTASPMQSPVKISPFQASPKTNSSAQTVKMAAMTTSAKTVEEQLAELQAELKEQREQLHIKGAQLAARDLQIARMLERFEMGMVVNNSGGASQEVDRNRPTTSASAGPPQEDSSSDDELPPVAPMTVRRGRAEADSTAFTIDAVNELINRVVRNSSGDNKFFAYWRPYTQRIQNIPMPVGYHPPKFQQFNGDGHPKQHVAHFIETCNNAGTDGDLLVKQFDWSLKGNAFDWYIELPQESIDSWEQLERDFLSQFYSTLRTMTLVEIANLKQKKGEKVVDYINRWRNLSLNCKESSNLSLEAEIEMPNDFQELATEAHNMENLIEERGEEGSSSANPRKKGKAPAAAAPKVTKEKTKSSSATNAFVPIKIGSKTKAPYLPRQLTGSTYRKLSLEERQAKTYPFADADVPIMLDQLLDNQLLRLPEIKRTGDQSKSKDPNFCKYHRLVGHSTEKCFVLKDRIMELAAQGRIEIEGAENTASSHTISIQAEPRRRTQPHKQQVARQEYRPKSGPSNRSHHNNKSPPAKVAPKLAPRELAAADAEGWILVTRRKKPLREVELAPENTKVKRPNKKATRRQRKALRTDVQRASKKKRRPITLAEFFPKEFFTPPVMAVTCSTAPLEPTAAKDKGKRLVVECDDLETSLKQISPLNKIEDDLDLDIRSRQALIRVLDKLEKLKAKLETLLMRKHDLPKVGLTPSYRKEEEDALSSPQLARSEQTLAVTCPSCITFREEDAQLGTRNHNRALFVSGYIRDHKINRILIDCGSAVNILLIHTMKNVGLSAGDLSLCSLLIQGFNQESQRTLGMANLKLHIGDIVAETPFQVIDSRTSYNLLLGRPWLHSNGVVPSTLHQCFNQSNCKAAKCTHSAVHSTVAKEAGQALLVVCNETQSIPLPENVTVPLPKLEERSIIKPVLNREQLPATRSNEGFDPNAYQLMARAGGNLTKDEIHAKSPVTLPVFTPEQEKLKNEGHRISQGHLGLGYEKPKPIKIYTSQAKLVKITRKSSADVHQVSVGQIPTEKQNTSKPVIIYTKAAINRSRPKNNGGPVVIYTLKAAIARARAYDSVMVNHISITDNDQEEDEFVLKEAPAEFEDGGQSTVDELKKVDFGTAEDPRPTFLSASLTSEEETEYMALLHEYRDIFAWNYTEMPGLDPRVAVHKLAVHPSVRPIKQSEVKYPSWIANIVLVKKKTGQIQVCVDFRDLNKACPKDEFPLPITDLMVDATTGHEALSFMDGSSGYNQIRMDPKDEELTAFRTPKGIFCYKVMPFGLKNAAATYQRAMQNIFDDFLHKRVECYVDDLVVKTKQRVDHLLDLRAVFERLRRFQLKMNPLKCTFGVTSGKCLGFIVHHRGIEIDQLNIDAIQKMSEPRNVSKLKSFQAVQPIAKERYTVRWDEACRNAFNNIKVYLTKPSVLVAPFVGRPLLLYIAAQERSVGPLLAQGDGDNKEHSLYYLSRTLVGAELNYTPIEKTCLALIFAIQKHRHYLLAHSTNLISRADPLKYIMSRPILSGQLAKWALLLFEFEINFVPQRAIKGQALANFLADHPVPAEWELTEEFPDEEIFLIELTGEFEVKKLELEPLWRHAGELLAQIPEASLHYVPRSENGPADALAGIAANLALFDQRPCQVPICERWVIPPPVKEETEEDETEETEESLPISASQNHTEDWREAIINFLRHGTLPVDLRERAQIRRVAPKYVFIHDILYRRSYEGLLLRCLSKEEGSQVLKETHSGICGAHQAGLKLHLQVKRLGYYWPSMLRDAIEMARSCKQCQLHADYIHQAPELLHPTVASWPFEAWGMDIIGLISPKSDSDRQYILAATDYFSKRAEATAYREVKRTSTAYNPPANGHAEAFNKKTIGANKRSWDEKLCEALWAYRTSFRTPTQSTPFSLVYGTEAVLPLEVRLPSLRIAMREGLTTEECAQLRLAELESLDEQRLEAHQRLECYQSRMTKAFNKKVRLRSFQKGDLVLAVRRPMLFTSKTGGKFAPKWEGPYVVQEAYTNGAYKLVSANGLELPIMNGKFLKRFYP